MFTFRCLTSLSKLLVVLGETSVTSTSTVTGSNTPPTTVQATPSLGGNETTAMAGGTVTTAAGGNTVTLAVGGGTVTTAAGGGSVTTAVGGGSVTTAMGGNTVTSAVGGGAVTTAMSGGGGEGSATTVAGSGISSSKTTTTITSSVVPDKEQGNDRFRNSKVIKWKKWESFSCGRTVKTPLSFSPLKWTLNSPYSGARLKTKHGVPYFQS